MAYDSRVYRILIASPSDVYEEREVAVRVIQDWNNLHSSTRKVVVLPVRWETHTSPEYNVRPQAAINRQIVDDCDLLVGIFWTRLGTPTGGAESGTLEEIERVARAGKPVLLYFSHVPIDPEKINTEQIARLRDFKQRIKANALIESFGSPLEFRDKFAPNLEMKIQDIHRADDVDQPSPLALQFASLDSGELIGDSQSLVVDLPEEPGFDPEIEQELLVCAKEIFAEARSEAGAVPLVLAIKNLSAVGIRNVFVEMSIHPVEGSCGVATSPARRTRHQWNFALTNVWLNEPYPSDIEQKFQKLSGAGLTKDGEQWTFSFAWDALQPQRVRYIEPLAFVQAEQKCELAVHARVYADSFASPIVLSARVRVDIASHASDRDALLETAREVLKQRKSLSTTFTLPNPSVSHARGSGGRGS